MISRRTIQPQFPAPIDARNQLTNQLVLASLPARGVALLNAVGKGGAWSNVASVPMVPSAAGLGHSFNGTSQYLSLTESLAGTSTPGAQAFTLASVAVPADTSTAGCLVSISSSTDALPFWVIKVNGTAGCASMYVRSGGSGSGSEFATSATFTAGQRVVVVGRQTAGNDRSVFLNALGSKVSNSTDLTADTFPSLDRTTIGNLRRSSDTWLYKGSIQLACIWLRALSDSEVGSFLANPWQIFAPSIRRVWVPAGGPAAYTLDAVPGAYTLTGSAAALTSDRALPAAPGSYSLSGSDASLMVGRNLACGAGAYSLTGADASLVSSAADKILEAEPGAYSLAGSDAALIVDRNLDAGAGAYTLTGAAASMVVASPGSGTGATVAEIWAYEIEPGISAAVAMRRILAMLCGKVSGAGTASEVFRDVGDTRDAVTIVSDESGNRTSVTFNDAA